MQVTTQLRQSLLVRLVLQVSKLYSESGFREIFERFGRFLTGSLTAELLRRFFDKPYQMQASLVGRYAHVFSTRMAAVRSNAGNSIRSSLTAKVFQASTILRYMGMYIVVLSGFYVFIDELGRMALGQTAFFGLWDELYILVCLLFLMLDWALNAKRSVLSTPMDAPLFFFIAIAFFELLHFATYPEVAIDGFRVVVQYLLFYFVASRFLTTDKRADVLYMSVMLSGTTLALHGLFQIVTGVQSPASWTDQAEASLGATRAFSIVESPNILGSIMVLLLPSALAFVLSGNQKKSHRVFFFLVAGAMGLCVLLTLSRGAWMSLAVAMVVFSLAVNPRWLLLLMGGGILSLAIPQVNSRIAYLFTPQFMASSMKGGRIMRYETGIRMFLEKPWTGWGLGHFGGATAMNNKNLFPNTFYMDNYWLKTAVEMGIPGLVGFGFLILFLVIWSIRAIRTTQKGDKLRIAGAFAGICGVLVHNGLENIFEVPYMVVYFWLMVALMMYWGFRGRMMQIDISDIS